MKNVEIDSAPSKRKLVLLTDNDESFRKKLRVRLEHLRYDVREAENGLVAKTIYNLNSNSFDVIIAAVRTPELDGVSLLKHVRKENTSVKFILMTALPEVLSIHQAHALGANWLVAKPFEPDLIGEAIHRCYEPISAEVKTEAELANAQFCRIPVDDFITSSQLLVDLHVRLGNRYVKIARAGDVVPVERLMHYKEKKVDFFHVLPDDMRKLVSFNLRLKKAAEESAASKETRLKLLTNTATLIAQSWYYDSVDRSSLISAKEVIDNTINMCSDEPNLLSLLNFMQNEGDQMYAHCVGVSVYSCMLGRKLGHTSQMVQMKLALGGLMHDIGKKELPLNILSKARLEMSAAEIKLYESHCFRGKELLNGVPGIPEDVITIVAHHHENNVGTGFPYHLSANRIHPLAKIVAVVDFFVNDVFKCKHQDKKGIQETLKKLAENYALEYDKKVIQALMSLFDFQPKKGN
jgi:response regulator RpfG family c-di-GMP phosphodiesterase